MVFEILLAAPKYYIWLMWVTFLIALFFMITCVLIDESAGLFNELLPIIQISTCEISREAQAKMHGEHSAHRAADERAPEIHQQGAANAIAGSAQEKHKKTTRTTPEDNQKNTPRAHPEQ